MSRALPPILNCDHCAACCRRTPIPPFQPGEESVWNVPTWMLEPVHERIRRDEQFELLPCVWLDLTTLRCRHYEFRPQACRDFEIGSTLCRLSRDDEGIQNTSQIGEPSASGSGYQNSVFARETE